MSVRDRAPISVDALMQTALAHKVPVTGLAARKRGQAPREYPFLTVASGRRAEPVPLLRRAVKVRHGSDR